MVFKEKVSKFCRDFWNMLKGIDLKFRSSQDGDIRVNAKSPGVAEFKYERKEGSSEISLNIEGDEPNIDEKIEM